jgi:hypothetical protein
MAQPEITNNLVHKNMHIQWSITKHNHGDTENCLQVLIQSNYDSKLYNFEGSTMGKKPGVNDFRI